MRLVAIAEWILGVSAGLGLIGFVVSGISAWRFREEIMRAEVHRAAQVIRAQRKLQQEHEDDEALVKMA